MDFSGEKIEKLFIIIEKLLKIIYHKGGGYNATATDFAR
jgi:hypothetical protein